MTWRVSYAGAKTWWRRYSAWNLIAEPWLMPEKEGLSPVMLKKGGNN